MQIRIFNFRDGVHFDDVVSRLLEVSNMDSTFKFTSDREKMEVMLEDDDRDRIHKRACWIIYKADPFKRLVFTVVR